MKKTKIKLTRVENAPYKCHATYEYKDNTIECDSISLSGDRCYWTCEPMFKGVMFRTLKGVRHAIELKENGELNAINLQWCEEE